MPDQFKGPRLGRASIRMVLAFCMWGAASLASAQAFVAPAWLAPQSRLQVGGGYASSTIEYDQDSGHSFEVERTALFADVAYGVARSVDLFGQLSLITKTEVENYDDSGDGLGLTFGLRALPYQRGSTRLGLLATYAFTDESAKSGGVKVKLKTNELRLGPTLGYALSDKFIPYVSLMLTLMGEGEMKATVAGSSTTRDFERDNKITLEVGGDVPLGTLAIHFGVVAIGEQTFILGLRGTL